MVAVPTASAVVLLLVALHGSPAAVVGAVHHRTAHTLSTGLGDGSDCHACLTANRGVSRVAFASVRWCVHDGGFVCAPAASARRRCGDATMIWRPAQCYTLRFEGTGGGAAVDELTWRTAVSEAFGRPALVRPPAGTPASRLVANEAPYRAISLATLERIWVFLMAMGGRAGQVTNPHTTYGRACSSGNLPCMRDADCPAGQSCNKQRVLALADVDMNFLNAQLVKPLTKFTGVSFVEHVGGGKPTYFVSHNWGASFQAFLASVTRHFQSKGHTTAEKASVFYWVCTFANNQHAVELGDSPQDSPFAKAIQLSHEVVSIQDRPSEVKFTLRRAWCVLEMQIALQDGKDVVFVCPNGAILTKSGYMDPSGPRCHCSIVNNLKAFKVDRCVASLESDKTKVVGYIRRAARLDGCSTAGASCLESRMAAIAASEPRCGTHSLTSMEATLRAWAASRPAMVRALNSWGQRRA